MQTPSVYAQNLEKYHPFKLLFIQYYKRHFLKVFATTGRKEKIFNHDAFCRTSWAAKYSI